MSEKLCHSFKLDYRLVIADLDICKRNIDYEYYLLLYVVERDDLVEQHKVDILEPFGVYCLYSYGRLAVAEKIISEISDQSSCEGG